MPSKPSAPRSRTTRQPAALDRASEQPLYQQLAAKLLERIDSGQLAAGERLPSEPELMAEHGVSRVTVRQAIALLARSGKLSAHRGKGTFVAGRVVHHDLDALQGFYQALRGQGIEPETTLLDWSTDAGALDGALPPGLQLPVRLQRLYAVDGKPFAMVTGYLPREAAALGKARAARLTVYEILAQFMGTPVDRADVTIRCERAPREIATLLGLPRGGMVLLMERQSRTRGGEVCEFMRIHILPERYEFRLQVTGQLELASAVHPAAARTQALSAPARIPTN